MSEENTETKVCGVPGWDDTDGSVGPSVPELSHGTVWATSEYQGIVVRWTYPTVDPHAIAYIELYRAKKVEDRHVDQPPPSGVYEIVGGSHYFDLVSDNFGEEFLYWIKFVRRDGAKGDYIGPARARMATEEDYLPPGARDEIWNTMVNGGLTELTEDISNFGSILSASEQKALFGFNWLDQLLSGFKDSMAAIDARIWEVQDKIITDEYAAAVKIEGLSAKFEKNWADTQSLQLVFASQQKATAYKADQVQAKVVGPDGEPLLASVESVMDVVTDLEEGVYAKYSVNVETTGPSGVPYIGGFTIDNNNNTVDTVFASDTFAIVAPGAKGPAEIVAPFYVSGGKVYLKSAVIAEGRIKYFHLGEGSVRTAKIQDAAITTAKIDDAQVQTLKIDNDAVVVSNADWGSTSASCALKVYGGRAYASASCVVECDDSSADIEIFITDAQNGRTLAVQTVTVRASDSSNSGRAVVTIPAAISCISGGGSFQVYARAYKKSGSATVHSMLLSLAGYKR